jgi:ribosomal protein S18 acetylase RimI-like enzyme
VKLVCDRESFLPRCDSRVRWLDWCVDYPLVQQAWAEAGVTLTYEDWLSARDQGYTYCGIAENGILASVAAVWTYSEEAWEVAAVATMSAYRRRGLATAVVSFVTDHILSSGRLATCHTRRDNRAMTKTAEGVGFRVMTEE